MILGQGWLLTLYLLTLNIVNRFYGNLRQVVEAEIYLQCPVHATQVCEKSAYRKLVFI
jgi:hypothetical protein